MSEKKKSPWFTMHNCNKFEYIYTVFGTNHPDSSFLPAQLYASAGLCYSDVSVCPSVCLDVCHTPVLCLAERKQDREMYTI